jgi:membrane dipeptidase
LPQISATAQELHSRSLVVDTHADTTQRLLSPAFDLAARQADGSVDIPRMREGGVGAIFFAIWVPGTVTGREAVARAFHQIHTVRTQIASFPQDLCAAISSEEMRAAHKAGKIAVLMGLEGGHMIDSDLGVLREFASLGVCYLTLTHMRNTDWADASTDVPRHNGLSEFGQRAIEEMNELGMLVDVSHASDKTFDDALAISAAPIFASHSSCRALCDSPRNLSDRQMEALAAKGGVIQINFHVAFLSEEFRRAENENPALSREIESLANSKEPGGGSNSGAPLESGKAAREAMAQGRLPKVDYTEILRHIDHAVEVVGIDHVGLGSDFDGAYMPCGMEDASCVPRITDGLLQRGYDESNIQKILGGNTLRLMQDVQNPARSRKEAIA